MGLLEMNLKNPVFVKYRGIIFMTYSYFNHVLNMMLNIFPPIIRSLVLKLILGKFGTSSYIDYGCYIRYPSKIQIGKKVEINRGFQVYPSMLSGLSKIVIEDGVVIGPNVCLYGAGQKIHKGILSDTYGDIVIRQGAYIGANCVIRYGTEIGAFSVVGAGSVVVKNIRAHSRVAGNPAKMLKKA